MWLFLIVDIIIALVTILGIVADLPLPFLGLSVIAIANSVGDTVNNLAITKKGYSTMALSASYAGPTFYSLVG